MHGGNYLADTEYARKRKTLFQLMRDLRNIGADDELRLPCIAVIGGQSAGKSSLVEAITGIKVPRDSGTCTKCPMECSVAISATIWSCLISLKATHGSIVPFSPLLTSKDDVDIWIRRAQTAILSPHKRQEDFLDKSYMELQELTKGDPQMKKFAEDAVVVHIEDPEGTELMFIDLPGLIQNADGDYIDLVRGLVQRYIQDPSTIILVTVPASDDLENQEAMKLAREADGDGERTICVVTKPDTIAPGSSGRRQQWREIFLGHVDAHRLRHGYYSVRLPDDDDRKQNVTRAQVDEAAQRFFQSSDPWNDLGHLKRLGIPYVVSDISKVLMKIIQDALPELKAQIQMRLKDCQTELATLPPPVEAGKMMQMVMGKVSRFCDELKEVVEGRSEDKSFVHRCRAMFRWFKLAVRTTAPEFRPFPEFERYKMPQDSALEVDSDDTEDTDNMDLASYAPPVMGLYDVRKVIKESTGWQLPHNTPYEAKTRLYKEFVDRWSDPAQTCFTRVLAILRHSVDLMLTAHFERFPKLEQHLRSVVQNEISCVEERSLKSLEEVLTREGSPFFTQNTHYLEASRNKFLARYVWIYRHRDHYLCGARCASEESVLSAASEGEAPAQLYAQERIFARIETPQERALKALSELGYEDLKVEDFRRLHPPDQFEEELEMMADVRALFQVAYKRIIDNVPTTIHHSVNVALAYNMQNCLFEELTNLGMSETSERFQALLAEDPEITALRAERQTLQKRLLEIQVKLNGFVA